MQRPFRTFIGVDLGGGKGNAASLLECVEMIAQVCGKRPQLTYSETNRIGDHICYYTDMGKFRDHFPGWHQEWTLDAIVDEMVGAMAAKLDG